MGQHVQLYADDGSELEGAVFHEGPALSDGDAILEAIDSYAKKHGLSKDQKEKITGRVVSNSQDVLPS
jgi:hypothetical protein